MGLLTGRMTCRRFSVEGDVPDNYHDAYAAQLDEYGFREPIDVGSPPEEVEGWVRHDNVMDVDFSDRNTWSYSDYIIFSMRIDTRKIPPKLLTAKTKAAALAWAEEHGVERVPASVLTEIRESVKDALLRRALPKLRVFEVIWNVSGGYVLFSSTADNLCDRLRKRFYRTFGLKLEPSQPHTWLAPGRSEGLLSAAGPVVASMEFLTWFWWHSEENGMWRLGELEIDGWVDGRVALASPASLRDKAVLSGDSPSVAPEARAALSGGKATIELMFGVRSEEREFLMTLKGPHLDMFNVRFPTVMEDHDDAAIYDRMYLYEEAFRLICLLFEEFARLRVSRAWDAEIVPTMKEWIEAPAPVAT